MNSGLASLVFMSVMLHVLGEAGVHCGWNLLQTSVRNGHRIKGVD